MRRVSVSVSRGVARPASVTRGLHDSSKFQLALTYDDVLLVPKFSDVVSRKSVSLRTQLSTNIFLNNPIVSSNMDTVTEDKMAIAMAKNGGIGILHRFLSVTEQVEQVRRVKRAEAFIIEVSKFCVNLLRIEVTRATARSPTASTRTPLCARCRRRRAKRACSRCW